LIGGVSTSYAVREVGIEIKADYKTKVSPELYGLFFEEINHAGDGGLYAEMVVNRTFKELVLPENCKIENGKVVTANGWPGWSRLKPQSNLHGWSEIAQDGGQVTISIDDQSPLNKQNYNSLKVEVKNAQGRAGFANEGYWGMAVVENENYNLSFYANSPTNVNLTASIESIDGNTIYATSTINNVQGTWKQYKCKLTANKTGTKARLVITVDRPATLKFNIVSLFPEKTYKNRENGWRVDIYEKLAALKPKFLRFPGGCFVEGCTLDNRYKWKETIGPVEERPGHWNVWGYRSMDGIGYHEYLQLAEDLNAEVLYVVNVGLSCQFRKAEVLTDSQIINLYVQDALDALEYAMGSTDTKWGAARVKNGRSNPFKIKYIEIGNENHGADYNRLYQIFYDAIKAKYPEIITIATAVVPDAPLEVVDEHYYKGSNWFLANSNLYDKQNRKGPKIYVGEYAVHTGIDEGNLGGAIAEAAFMMGIERNSDIVTMASYSEMLQNSNDRGWNYNAIHFDSSRIFGRSSYYIQEMFMNNTPTVMVDCNVVDNSDSHKPSIPQGLFGLRTYATDAEFKDIRITQDGNIVYASDFSKGSQEWGTEVGSWITENGVYRQSNNTLQNTAAYLNKVILSNCTIELKAKRNSGSEGFMVMIYKNDGYYVQWNLGGYKNTQHVIHGISDYGCMEDFTIRKPGSIELNRWYDLKLVLNNGHIDFYLDGQLIQSADINTNIPRFFANAGIDEKSGELIIKLVNPTGEPIDTKLSLTDFSSISSSAEVITLSGENPLAENSFDNPTKISPIKSTFDGVDSNFIYTVKPWSATILRFGVKKGLNTI